MPEPETGWLLELAFVSGLLDVGGPHRDEWLPTRAYDFWREQDLPSRWAALAVGWLGAVRLPSLVGHRDVAGKAVLVRTGWDRHWRTDAYQRGHPFLTGDAARHLVDQGALLVERQIRETDTTLVEGRHECLRPVAARQ